MLASTVLSQNFCVHYTQDCSYNNGLLSLHADTIMSIMLLKHMRMPGQGRTL